MSATDSTSPLDALLAQAIAHHQAGRLESAQHDYDQILQQQPDHALVLHNRGLLLSQQGRHVEGVADLRRAVQLAPDEGEFWLSLARGLVQSGAPDEALDIVDHVHQRGYHSPSADQVRTQAMAALTPEPPATVKQTIIDLYNAGQLAEMEQATRALLARRPQSTFGWSVLGTALQSQGKSPRDALLRLIELAPHDAEAHTHLGDDLQSSGEFEESLSSYLRAIELAPRHAAAHCNLGSALEALGRNADAQESYRRAITADPANLSAHFNLGNSLRNEGRYDDAIVSYRNALALAPSDTQLLTHLADTLRAQHQFDEAVALYNTVLEQLPDLGEAWANLGTTLQSAGDLDGAVTAQLRALELDPGLNALHGNLALALRALARHKEAEYHYRAALALEPRDASLHNGLANVLNQLGEHQAALDIALHSIALAPDQVVHYLTLADAQQSLGRQQEAIATYHTALALDPASAETMANLAVTLQETGQLDEALSTYRQALELAPDAAIIYANFGVTLQRLGRADEALAAQQRALELDPELVLAHINLGALHHELGNYEQSLQHGQQALALRPDDLNALRNLASSLQMLKRHEEALDYCVQALQLAPDTASIHFDMGNSYRALGRPADAMRSFEQALAIDPDYSEVYTNMVPLLHELGKRDEALDSCRRALELDPGSALKHSNLLFALSHDSTDAELLFEEHCRFGDSFEAALRPHWRAHDNNRDPDRPLRLGWVSGDFNQHALASFVEPVFEVLCQYPGVEMHGFYNKLLDDSMTQRLRAQFGHWHNITNLSDETAEQLIRDAGIDILIDLAGHSAANRLPLFARKPAPIQCSWIGYPGTTGLLAVDYFLSDAQRMPEGRYDSQFTEHIVRMPLGAPFLPERISPEINALPALQQGYLTFGSFHRANKLSRDVVALWSGVLRALPDARLLLAGLSSGESYDELLAWFAEEGVDQQRLELHTRGTMMDYLKLHHRIDICLTPFPYTGATTLLHALWMGVPSLTMTGATVPSYGAASYMIHLGLEAFVTEDPQLFIQRAVFLSNNLQSLSVLRASLRQRFQSSIVGQPAVAAAGLERAFRIMWQRWCANIAPGPIRVELDDILAPSQEAAP